MFSAERDVTRTKGLHLSHIIDYIEHLEGKRAEQVRNGGLSDAGNAYASGGFLWERVVANLIERKPAEMWDWLFTCALNEPENPLVVRPGEQCLDAGICPVCEGKGSTYTSLSSPVLICSACKGTGRVFVWLTPDGYHIDDMILEEWKATSKSCRDVDLLGPKFKRWTLFQIPVYLKALYLDTCRLRVYFSRGDYTTGEPQFWEYLLHYSKQEIEETWDMIAQHAVIMYREGLI